MFKDRLEQPTPGLEDQAGSAATFKSASFAYSTVRPLWQPGDLFHNFSRFPERPEALRVDRLALILERGLVAPAACDDGSVRSDLNIVVVGGPVAYDSLVFIHRLNQHSGIYITSRPGHFTILIKPNIPVLTPVDMGVNWPVMCADEVYVRDRVGPEYLSGLVIHPQDGEEVLGRFLPHLKKHELPVYLLDGTVLWPREVGGLQQTDQPKK